MDAGTLLVTNDALDDQIKQDASAFGNAVATGSWITAALVGAGLLAALVKKFVPVKKVEKPAPVKSDEDADKAADKARSLLLMGKPEDE